MKQRARVLLFIFLTTGVQAQTASTGDFVTRPTDQFARRGSTGGSVDIQRKLLESNIAKRIEDFNLVKELKVFEAPGAKNPTPSFLLSKYRPEKIVPTGEDAGSQAAALRQIAFNASVAPADLSAALARLGVSIPSNCSKDTVLELAAAQSALNNEPVGDRAEPDSRLYRSLLKLDGSNKETANSLVLIKRLEFAWRSVLKDCFLSPISAADFLEIRNRVGTFSTPLQPPFCSGTLVEDGKILTARHCFIFSETGERTKEFTGLRFTFGDGSASIPIDVSKQLANTPNSAGPAKDWIVISAPLTGRIVTPLRIAEQLRSFAEAASSKTEPTALALFSLVPLASALAPTDFPAGLAGYKSEGCFVAYKDGHCITHMCSSVNGGSGASLFVRGVSGPLWVGLHVASESTKFSCSGNASSIAANFALRADTDLQKFFYVKDVNQ